MCIHVGANLQLSEELLSRRSAILASSRCYKGKCFILRLPEWDFGFVWVLQRQALHFMSCFPLGFWLRLGATKASASCYVFLSITVTKVSSEIRKTCASFYVFLSIAVTKVSSETCMHKVRPRHFVPLPTPLPFPPVRPRGPGTTLLVLGFGGRPRLDSTPYNIIMA